MSKDTKFVLQITAFAAVFFILGFLAGAGIVPKEGLL